MIKITMFSQAEKVSGQGVGSAYSELMKTLKKNFSDTLEIKVNTYGKSDISHYHTINPTFYFSTFFKKSRGVRVGYVHFLPETLEGSITLAKPFKAVFDKYLMSFYKRMDQLVVVNPDFINKLEALGVSREKVAYIPNFVSTDVFFKMSDTDKQAFRRDKLIEEEKFVVLGVGQIQKRKGVDDFIELAKRNPDIQFIWAGGFSFGKITDGYDEYKEIYDNPPANLLFTGIIDREEIVGYYNIANVFLLPSFSELFPVSVLEAFNCETPVMLRHLDLYTGILGDSYLKAEDAEQMDQLLKEYAGNPEKLEEYRVRSKEAAAYYSEEHTSKRWLEYYSHLVGKEVFEND
ncbi:glycosyltransferase family 4 protein [Enterococcus sp. BWB1-3]|uniref:glycosyltransferase family 4 protein n=1 Tax=unclassified Enterococcus TaxID=2608891 RepID=UPI0019204738|nr:MULTISPECIES: glycosyltransferase family 4 protein [unclassified Enterococcus]MBL1229186.1 glycosyltransferase family 4 protein [Enterococcus sp. BWB1-3]MCB5952566.1 glycosyltransferase family 4 protein [Enterococcus sp. BWT-B8]